MGLVDEIQVWYETQCNGDWEHDYGLTIVTLDNPGWKVTINLTGTKLVNKHFEILSKNVPQKLVDQAMGKIKPPFIAASPTSADWFLCSVQEEKFEGAGSPQNLTTILEAFLKWSK